MMCHRFFNTLLVVIVALVACVPSPNPLTMVPGGVLPAPLYLLVRGQVWRIDVDAQTVKPVVGGETPVLDMSISPNRAWIAYVMGNALWKADSNSAAFPLVQGRYEESPIDLLQAFQSFGAIHSLLWSLDNQYIAYTQGNLHISPANGGMPSRVQPTMQPSLPLANEWITRPLAWSGDSKRLLVEMRHDKEMHWGIYLPGRNRLLVLEDPSPVGNWNGYTARWSSDPTILYAMGPYPAQAQGASLWSINGQTGEIRTLYAAAQWAFGWQRDKTTLYGFGAMEANPSPLPSVRMMLTQLENGTHQFIRTEEVIPREVLWAADGSGAVVLALDSDHPAPFPNGNRLLWIPTKPGSAVVTLPLVGSDLQWGQ